MYQAALASEVCAALTRCIVAETSIATILRGLQQIGAAKMQVSRAPIANGVALYRVPALRFLAWEHQPDDRQDPNPVS